MKMPKPLLLFFVFTLSYIALDVFFIRLANESYNGIVTEEAYQKGLDYNKVLHAAKLQDEAELRGDLAIMPLAQQAELYRISFCLSTPQGHWHAEEVLKLHLLRPTHHQEDHSLDLTKGEQNCYHTMVKLAPGQWEARVKAMVDGIKFYHHQRLVIPADPVSDSKKLSS